MALTFLKVKLTDAPKSWLLNRLKIWHEFEPNVTDFTGPVSMNQLDFIVLCFFLFIVISLLLLVLEKQFSKVILVLNFLHCLYIVIGARYIKELYLRFSQKVGFQIAACRDQPVIVVEFKDVLLENKQI